MRKSVLIPLAIFLAAAALAAIGYFSRGREDAGLRVAGIIDGTEVNLASKVAGRISSIGCGEGDDVRKGQVAVTLESEDIRASVRQAEAGVERARSDVAVARASVENGRADVRAAEADIRSAEADRAKAREQMEESKRVADRRVELYERSVIARESRDQAVSDYQVKTAAFDASGARLSAARSRKDAAVGRLNAAIARVRASRAARREAEANLGFYRSKLEDTVVEAPISGTVIFRAHEAGETVSPGETILTIVDMGSLYARVDIDETRIGGVVLNGEARVTVDGMPGREFRGRIAEIGRHAAFATQRDVVRGREDIKTFRVKVAVDDPSGILKPGMTVEVAIPGKR